MTVYDVIVKTMPPGYDCRWEWRLDLNGREIASGVGYTQWGCRRSARKAIKQHRAGVERHRFKVGVAE